MPATRTRPTKAVRGKAARATAAPGAAAAARAGDANGARLVIVESPAKARTIAGYLGPGFVVESSIGHIRDLPRGAADVPAQYKGESWARLGVDVDHGFTPLYVVSRDRKEQVAKLKRLVKDARELYLATDEDREGEAIAWHLVETLQPRIPVHRMVFHEITRPAIEHAVANPRQLDSALVDAQETRRILDRLYGYEVSPVLWKKVLPRLSAGRVQSVATRIVVERERARMAFRAADYWGIEGTFAVPGGEPPEFTAGLVALDGEKVASGRDFDPATGRPRAGVVHLDEPGARGLAARLAGAAFQVTRVDDKPYRRRPYPPFMTSTLQQEAGRKLRFTAQHTMRVAQRLYENGYITYMRTDSTALSEAALTAARQQARQLYGDAYVPAEPRRYVRKVKNAQEAHEAIRPAGDTFRTPSQVAGELDADGRRLYELIWQRTIASQMADAVGRSVTVRLAGESTTAEVAEFSAAGTTISFPGFLRAYVEGRDEDEAGGTDAGADGRPDGRPDGGPEGGPEGGPGGAADDAERRLPEVARGQQLAATALDPRGHRTTPPPRYTEASLVKALEDLGIGRPSTYAAILRTIVDRGYVWKRGAALVPSWLAFAVVGLLEQHFTRLVDYDFTASVEGDLDRIAGGEEQSVAWLTRFYFGSPDGKAGGVAQAGGLKAMVGDRLAEIDARGVNSIPIGEGTVVRVGRYGPYVQRGVDDDPQTRRAAVPDDLAPDELTPEVVEQLLAAGGAEGRELGAHPQTGAPVTVKTGRYGPYVQCGDRRASLFAGMAADTVTLDDAVRLLTLPRVVGVAPDGEEVTAQNGRYGPYVKKGADSRSLADEQQLFNVTMEEALALFAQPKGRRARAAAAAPLRELGADPATGKPMVLREGRFGPYVTDGETNASLRAGDDVAALTAERAAELLADRRERGPARRPGRGTGKKAAPRKAAPRKAASTRKSAATRH